MTTDILQKANGFLRTLNFLKQAIIAVESLLGLEPDQKKSLKETLQQHHDAVQGQLDSL